MCSSAVAGTGDGLLISGQCWMGTKHRLCPGRSRDLLVVTGPLNSALLCHHITGLMWWPGIHCQTPVPALESQVPESPWEGRGHTSLGVWLVLNTHRTSCVVALPALLAAPACPAPHQHPGVGCRGLVIPCMEQGRCTGEGAAPLQPPRKGSHCLVATSWWSHLLAEEKPGALRAEGET